MPYRRGVFVEETDTSLLPPVRTGTVIVAIGTAPQGPVNTAVPIFSFKEFVDTFGWNDNFSLYTLCEVAEVAFARIGIAPVVFINVFDPNVHKDANGNPDPSQVSANDIIGGIDPTTYKRKGLECVNEVYPKYGLVPSILIAPRFSKNPSVALALALKAQNVSGVFKAFALADLDTSVAPADTPSYLSTNNLRHAHLKAFYGKGFFNGKEYSPSCASACVWAKLDFSTEDFPFHSISNKPLPFDSIEPLLDDDLATYLAGQGVTPLLRTRRGLVPWGTRTTLYPTSTDPKDTFDNVRRAFNFIANELILTFRQKLDFPITKRLIRTIVDSYNMRLNALKGREYILGGKVEFREQDNPKEDLVDGIIRFHVYLTPPSPAKEIHFILEYNHKYWDEIFKGG